MPIVKRLVFTDLDGTLLDHDTYEFEPAAFAVDQLKRDGVPLIFNSSKTFAEMRELQRAMGLAPSPMIAENGAGVFLPKQQFERKSARWLDRGAYWLVAHSEPRQHWLDLIKAFPKDELSIQTFDSLGPKGVAELTGLTVPAARLACEREFSEPTSLRGSVKAIGTFIDFIKARGGQVQHGGRFNTISGDCDKGRSMQWLANLIAQTEGCEVRTLALGDADNDLPMLNAANTAVWIQSAHRSIPAAVSSAGFTISSKPGPQAWGDAVTDWLQSSH